MKYYLKKNKSRPLVFKNEVKTYHENTWNHNWNIFAKTFCYIIRNIIEFSTQQDWFNYWKTNLIYALFCFSDLINGLEKLKGSVCSFAYKFNSSTPANLSNLSC